MMGKLNESNINRVRANLVTIDNLDLEVIFVFPWHGLELVYLGKKKKEKRKRVKDVWIGLDFED